jgi:hypothetical protein
MPYDYSGLISMEGLAQSPERFWNSTQNFFGGGGNDERDQAQKFALAQYAQAMHQRDTQLAQQRAAELAYGQNLTNQYQQSTLGYLQGQRPGYATDTANLMPSVQGAYQQGAQGVPTQQVAATGAQGALAQQLAANAQKRATNAMQPTMYQQAGQQASRLNRPLADTYALQQAQIGQQAQQGSLMDQLRMLDIQNQFQRQAGVYGALQQSAQTAGSPRILTGNLMGSLLPGIPNVLGAIGNMPGVGGSAHTPA